MVAVSGTGCPADEGFVSLVTADRQDGIALGRYETQRDGTWSGALVVPAAADPQQEYVLVARCANLDAVVLDYGALPFDVEPSPGAVDRTG